MKNITSAPLRLCAIILFALLPSAFILSAAKPPNFVIVYADDLGYADTSVQMMDADPSTKHKFIQTPGLERLAEIGGRFTAGYSPTPTCTGSRMSIQLGKSSAAVQYRNVNDVLAKYQRPEGWDNEVTMAQMLKDANLNYKTAFFGKGASNLGRFEDRGYDITDEIPGQVGGNGNEHGQYWDTKKKTPFPPDNPKRLHSLRKHSVDFINEYAGKQPFFVMVSHYAAHIPFACTREAFERNKKRWIEMGFDTDGMEDVPGDYIHKPSGNANADIAYAAMVEEMDMTVVDIIKALEKKGELDNTYIIFTSDNGGGKAELRKVNGENRRFNGPLQEGKRSIFEGGIRVPTLISGPGIKPGSEVSVPIVQYDFLATMHDLSGSKTPLPEGVDGGSLRDVFYKGNSGKVKRVSPGILHHYPCHYHPPISSIIIGDYKLMRHLNSGEIRLYNIKDDYREENNLAESMPEKVASMDKLRQDYVDKVDGGSADDVREAQFKEQDEGAEQSKRIYKNKLAALKKQNAPDFEAQKAKLLKELNAKLMKNEINKEKGRRHAQLHSWRGYVDKNAAEAHVNANWVDYTGE
ncbi:MAG: sulfatase-like hydrolase/transferase [Verrucomicrobia bacterium]|nr:sulfatase-like hydrolase/transferase [Verrucomicrobiota bacterium]